MSVIITWKDYRIGHCAITGPCLRMRNRPSARRLYRYGRFTNNSYNQFELVLCASKVVERDQRDRVPPQATHRRWTATQVVPAITAEVGSVQLTHPTLTLVDLPLDPQGRLVEPRRILRQLDELHRRCGLAVGLLDRTTGT